MGPDLRSCKQHISDSVLLDKNDAPRQYSNQASLEPPTLLRRRRTQAACTLKIRTIPQAPQLLANALDAPLDLLRRRAAHLAGMHRRVPRMSGLLAAIWVRAGGQHYGESSGLRRGDRKDGPATSKWESPRNLGRSRPHRTRIWESRTGRRRKHPDPSQYKAPVEAMLVEFRAI